MQKRSVIPAIPKSIPHIIYLLWVFMTIVNGFMYGCRKSEILVPPHSAQVTSTKVIATPTVPMPKSIATPVPEKPVEAMTLPSTVVYNREKRPFSAFWEEYSLSFDPLFLLVNGNTGYVLPKIPDAWPSDVGGPMDIGPYYADFPIVANRYPVLLMRSMKISPDDVHVKHIKTGLGIFCRDLSGGQGGCRVTGLNSDCETAEGLSIEAGDVILALEGERITNCSDLLGRVLFRPPHDAFSLRVARGTMQTDLVVTKSCAIGIDDVPVAYALKEGYAEFYFPQSLVPGFYFVTVSGGRGHLFAIDDIEWVASFPVSKTAIFELPSIFSPDGSMLVTGSAGNEVKVWRVEDGTLLFTLKDQSEKADESWPLAFSPDGNILASYSSNGKVHLWHMADQTHLHEFEHEFWPTWYENVAVFSPDGSTIVMSNLDGDSIQLWSVVDGTLLREIPEPGVTNAAFSRDGAALATCDGEGTVRLWRVSDGTLLKTLRLASDSDEYEEYFLGMVFSPNNRLLAGASTLGRIWLWDLKEGRSLWVKPGKETEFEEFYSVRFSADGQTLFAVEDFVKIKEVRQDVSSVVFSLEHLPAIWIIRTSDGKILRRFMLACGSASSDCMVSILTTPSGLAFATVGKDWIDLWRISTP